VLTAPTTAPQASMVFGQEERLDGAVAGVGDAVLLAGRHQRVVDAQRKLHRYVKLPSELADIGDAERKQWCVCKRNPLHSAEWEGSIGHIVISQALDHFA